MKAGRMNTHVGRRTSEESVFFASQTNISDFCGGFSCLSQFIQAKIKTIFLHMSFLLLFLYTFVVISRAVKCKKKISDGEKQFKMYVYYLMDFLET